MVTRLDRIRFAIQTSDLTKEIKAAKNGDAKIEAIRKFVTNNDDGASKYFKILQTNKKTKISRIGIDISQTDYILKAFIKEYMRHPMGTGISNVITEYKINENKELVRDALVPGDAKVRTRKRGGLGKKNRITRRRTALSDGD